MNFPSLNTTGFNFVAFRFCDNDFDEPLRQAIEYINENYDSMSELSLEQYKELAVRGMVAFDSLRNPFRSDRENYDYKWKYDYFSNMMKVSTPKRIQDLENFEGYVIDINLNINFFGVTINDLQF